MRVILDTNVLLGALISPGGAPDQIYRAWRAGRFELVTSVYQLDELRRASRYPKLKTLLPAHRVGTMVNNMHRALVLGALPQHETAGLNDPNDAFLLAMPWLARLITLSPVIAAPDCCNVAALVAPAS